MLLFNVILMPIEFFFISIAVFICQRPTALDLTSHSVIERLFCVDTVSALHKQLLILIALKSASKSVRHLLLFVLAALEGFERLETGKHLLQGYLTNLWLVVNLRIHLRADQGEQTYSVSLS